MHCIFADGMADCLKLNRLRLPLSKFRQSICGQMRRYMARERVLMDWIYSSGLGYGACLALVAVYVLVTSRRAAAARRRRFVPYALAVGVWFAANLILWLGFHPTVFAPDASPAVGLIYSSLGGALALLAGGWFYAQLPGASRRQQHARQDFVRLLVVSGVLGFAWFWAWGWPAHRLPALRSLELLGAAAAGLLPLSYAFMVTVNPLVNVWRLFRRVCFYLGLCLLAAALIHGGLALYLSLGVRGAVGDGQMSLIPGPFFLYFAFLVVAILAATMGYLHHIYLKATIQYIFFRDVYEKEKVLNEFVNAVQAVDSSRENQESLLEVILQNVYRVFRFEKGFIVAASRPDQRRSTLAERRTRHIGPPPARLGFDRAPFLRLRLSEEFQRELDQAVLLEDDFPEPFANPEASAGKHRRAALRIRESLRSFREEGYTLFLPLIFRGEVWGALFLGPRADGQPYFNGERKLLENARLAFAMALRNNSVIEERELKAAEAGQPPLVNLTGKEEAPSVQRVKLGDRALVFASEGMHRLVDRTRRIASSILPVMIHGETGAGKELIARLVHHEGPGVGAPFVAVNCAAIPATLWESEIFGYRKGAFTGATRDHAGLVEQATGGILFFDEIGEMPLDIQPKILRLIQEKKFQAVGGKRLLDADCRLVFATHRDLAAMVQNGEFREDLYYRINVHRLDLPALRERRDDIPLLADFILEHYAREHGFARRSIEPRAREQLSAYDWPGNIRELENLLVRLLAEEPGALADSEGGVGEARPIELADLPEEVRRAYPGARPTAAGGANASRARTESQERRSEALFPEPEAGVNFERLMQDYARELIAHTLKVCEGNQTHAARQLGISRGKLIYQIKELGL